MRVRDGLRAAAWRVAPGRMADRARTYEVGVRQRTGLANLGATFLRAHGDRVLHGPVAGLRLCSDRIAEIDAPVAKLLGSYEQEIHGAIAAALARSPKLFVDLGAADGYFAAGVAKAAKVPVHAFDLSPNARDLTMATAARNGVAERMIMHRRASAGALAAIDLDRAFVLCDIDGPERDLFGEGLVEKLQTSTVIIEMHELPNPDVVDVLTSRFRATHEVEILIASPRDTDEYPELRVFDDEADRDHAVNELHYRFDGRKWLVATPREPGA
jgi:hypothetical protein